MIEAIRDHLFKRHYQKLNLPVTARKGGLINPLGSVTLLTQSPYHSPGEVRKAIAYFAKQEIICQAYMVDTTEIITPEEATDIDIIRRDEFRWIGIPRKDLLIKWLSYKTDVLISLNPDHSPLLRYLCAASNCQLKCAIDYGHKPENAIDFYLQLERATTLSVKDLSAAIYQALKNIS